MARNWRPVFLKALEHGCSIAEACRLAGVSRQCAYRARQRSPAFAEQWTEAEQTGVDALEDEAFRRAMNGSDSLLMFLLRAKRPHIFRDSVRMEHDLGKELLDALNRAARESAKLLGSSGRQPPENP
jgi:hypothetical protein